MEKSIAVAVPIEVLSLNIFIQPGRASLEVKAAVIELAKREIKLDDFHDNWGKGTTKPWWAIEELIAEGLIQMKEGNIAVSGPFEKLSSREEIIEKLKKMTGKWAKRRIVIDRYQNKIHSFRSIEILEDKPSGLYEEKEAMTDTELENSIQSERLIHLLESSNLFNGISSFDDEPEVSDFELISRELC